MGCCAGTKLIEIERFNYKKNFMNEKELKNITDIKIQTSNLIYGNTQPFHKHYKILSALGGGSFGKVFRCIHIATNQERAVKEIKLNNTKEEKGVIEDKIFKEVELLAQLDHPHIMKIFEYFKDESSFYIAMELLEGGDLYDYITKIKSFTEKDAAIIMSQLLSAVNYLHSKGIVHRDIKPENIAVEIPLEIERNPNKQRSKKETKQIKLPKSRDISSKRLIVIDSNKLNSPKLTNNFKNGKRNSIPTTGKKILNSKDINIKLLDFGASCYFSKNRVLTVKAGTPYYIAPEVIKKEYNNKCDIWSCGVILYVLLIGKPPFDGKNSQAVFDKILTGVFDKTSKEWNRLSTYAKSLIVDMLTLNYNNRPSAKDCLNHYWIKHNLDIFKSDNKLIYLTKKSSIYNMKVESISESESKSKSITDQKEEMVKDALDNLKRFSIILLPLISFICIFSLSSLTVIILLISSCLSLSHLCIPISCFLILTPNLSMKISHFIIISLLLTLI